MPVAAAAEDDSDHDLARDLYERGEILPLSEILAALGRRMPGDVVAVDLVRVGGRWVYRFQVVGPDGRRATVDLDAGPPGAATGGEGDDDGGQNRGEP
ncbi:MAG TPA: PepSY domain-containing protein [Bauldia sp.]|nr:PepSY domain-containing protein [Bauldia sp.]